MPHCRKFAPTGVEILECSFMRVVKCWLLLLLLLLLFIYLVKKVVFTTGSERHWCGPTIINKVKNMIKTNFDDIKEKEETNR